MRKQGTIIRWEAARGFGFVRSPAASADVFFHLRDLRGGMQPREGMEVSFEEIQVGGKGPRAMAVEAISVTPGRASSSAQPQSRARSRAEDTPPRRPRSQRQTTTSTGGRGLEAMLFVMAAYGGLLLWAVWASLLPWWIVPASFVLNLLTFWMYWVDKHAAQTSQWRTPENTLQFLALAGGWPGAWLAQQVLRHKSSKQSFQDDYWLMVISHAVLVGAWLFWPPLRESLTAWL
jgi:uncharacterized membrane protein YsdA (DUF1294 family)/cold shock CspA family protein